MEKPTRVKSKLLKLLPKAASLVTFQSPPLSPVGDRRIEISNKLKAITKGHPGPIVSMIPLEARRKTKDSSFDTREPTSPKVSCMGQVKSKKKKKKKSKPRLALPPIGEPKPVPSPGKAKKSSFWIFHKIFQGSNQGRKSGACDGKPQAADRTLSLSEMKRFSSRRDAFMNFDWRVHAAAVVPSDGKEGGDGQQGAKLEQAIPTPAGVEPRKAIDLWKRRTVAPPPRLQL